MCCSLGNLGLVAGQFVTDVRRLKVGKAGGDEFVDGERLPSEVEVGVPREVTGSWKAGSGVLVEVNSVRVEELSD